MFNINDDVGLGIFWLHRPGNYSLDNLFYFLIKSGYLVD